MDLRVKAWHPPPRLITGATFNAGLSKRGADDATAGQLHGFASGNLSVAWQAGRQAVHRPAVHGGDRHWHGPGAAGGAGLAGRRWLTAFALGTLGLYLRIPGMREEGSLRPTLAGHPLAKDADGWYRARPDGRRGR